MTDFLASMFDDPEDDPIEDENVRDGLGWRRKDRRPVKGTTGPAITSGKPKVWGER